MNRCYQRLGPTVAVLLGLTACGSLEQAIPDRRADYRQSSTANPLEVPPDLTRSTIDDSLAVPELSAVESASLATYGQERRPTAVAQRDRTVLFEPEDIRVATESNRRWLIIDQNAEWVWPRARDFWVSSGFRLQFADAAIGIMETDWAENRADISDGPIRNLLGSLTDWAYTAPTRDKFRVRLERISDNRTELFLTHYGLAETSSAGNTRGRTEASETFQWRQRPRDPELEAELLRRLMVFLGTSDQRASRLLASPEDATDGATSNPVFRRTEIQGGYPALVVDGDYATAWRLVGLSLDDSRFVIEEQDRANGLYSVFFHRGEELGSSERDESWLSSLAFWRDNDDSVDVAEFEQGPTYRLRLADQGTQTLVVVQNASGRLDASPGAVALLDAVVDALN